MPEVIVVGSANTDFTVKADRLPRPNETVGNGEFMISYGGKGANQAVASFKSGSRVKFLGRIGQDLLGNRLFDYLQHSGLELQGVVRDRENPAGVALIAVDREGNNQILVAPGSNRFFSVQDLNKVKAVFRPKSVLLTQLEIPSSTAEHALYLAKSRTMTTVLNPAPYSPLSDGSYFNIDVITPNESEAESLAQIKISDIEKAKTAARLMHQKGCKSVVITMGARGVLLHQGHSFLYFPAFKVEAVDSVGAGDAFNGALASELAAGSSLEESVLFACSAAALSVTKRGAQESMPSRKEILRLLNSSEHKIEKL